MTAHDSRTVPSVFAMCDRQDFKENYCMLVVGGCLLKVNIGEISQKFTDEKEWSGVKEAGKMKQGEHFTGHRPLLDFRDLRFIERPSLKRSQFTSQESRKT